MPFSHPRIFFWLETPTVQIVTFISRKMTALLDSGLPQGRGGRDAASAISCSSAGRLLSSSCWEELGTWRTGGQVPGRLAVLRPFSGRTSPRTPSALAGGAAVGGGGVNSHRGGLGMAGEPAGPTPGGGCPSAQPPPLTPEAAITLPPTLAPNSKTCPGQPCTWERGSHAHALSPGDGAAPLGWKPGASVDPGRAPAGQLGAAGGAPRFTPGEVPVVGTQCPPEDRNLSNTH